MTAKTMKTARPDIVSDEHLTYLDDLRESGVTMWGAGAYIQDEFDVSREDAKTILFYWMKTFGEETR